MLNRAGIQRCFGQGRDGANAADASDKRSAQSPFHPFEVEFITAAGARYVTALMWEFHGNWSSYQPPITRAITKISKERLSYNNPVIAASGTFGYGIEFEEIVSLEGIGGFVTKGISMEPMAGHAAPRIIQTAAGMLNAIGLQNVGVEEFIARKLPPLKRYPRPRSSSTSSATRWASTLPSSSGSTRPRALRPMS